METLEINVKAKGPEHSYTVCRLGDWYKMYYDGTFHGIAHFCRASMTKYDFIGSDGNRWFEDSIEVISNSSGWDMFRVGFKLKREAAKWKMVPVKINLVEEE
jgi:hypothetical protein